MHKEQSIEKYSGSTYSSPKIKKHTLVFKTEDKYWILPSWIQGSDNLPERIWVRNLGESISFITISEHPLVCWVQVICDEGNQRKRKDHVFKKKMEITMALISWDF